MSRIAVWVHQRFNRSSSIRIAALAIGLTSVTILASIAPRLGQPPGVEAHLGTLTGSNGYLWSETCGDSTRLDPINVIFANVGSQSRLLSVFDSRLPSWSNSSGSHLNFAQDDGTCLNEDAQRADGPDLSLSERNHIRFRKGHGVDPTYGTYFLAAVHHDAWVAPCLPDSFVPHHEGTLFNEERDFIKAAFVDGGYKTELVEMYNTAPSEQPCIHTQSDGKVAVIWLNRHCGTVPGNEVWTPAAVQIVDCDVTVAPGAALTIEPGTIVKFAANTGLRMNGGSTVP